MTRISNHQQTPSESNWDRAKIGVDPLPTEAGPGVITDTELLQVKTFAIQHLQEHFPDGPSAASYASECYCYEQYSGGVLDNGKAREAKRFRECIGSAYAEYEQQYATELPMHFFDDVDLSAYGGQARLTHDLSHMTPEQHAQVAQKIDTYFRPRRDREKRAGERLLEDLESRQQDVDPNDRSY